MSEYLHVEKPFLDQLAALDWKVTDQGQGFIPSDPAKSCGHRRCRGPWRQAVAAHEGHPSFPGWPSSCDCFCQHPPASAQRSLTFCREVMLPMQLPDA